MLLCRNGRLKKLGEDLLANDSEMADDAKFTRMSDQIQHGKEELERLADDIVSRQYRLQGQHPPDAHGFYKLVASYSSNIHNSSRQQQSREEQQQEQKLEEKLEKCNELLMSLMNISRNLVMRRNTMLKKQAEELLNRDADLSGSKMMDKLAEGERELGALSKELKDFKSRLEEQETHRIRLRRAQPQVRRTGTEKEQGGPRNSEGSNFKEESNV